ncbi:MAG: DUF4956 domain-containing protein [Planctomycetota bacterium]|jgi:hypothetical protein
MQSPDLKGLLKDLSDFGAKGLEETGVPAFVLAIGFSLGSAFYVSWLYRTFFGSRATGSQIHRAFPLLGISITAIFITIQFSLPLSLGLLGALSIVRFRTPIKEPEEVAFLMLVVASALSCATFNITFLGLVLAAATGALSLTRLGQGKRGPKAGHGLLVVAVPTEEYRDRAREVLDALAEGLSGALDSVVEGEHEASVSYRFELLAPEALSGVKERLSAIAPSARVNVYYDRAATA